MSSTGKSNEFVHTERCIALTLMLGVNGPKVICGAFNQEMEKKAVIFPNRDSEMQNLFQNKQRVRKLS